MVVLLACQPGYHNTTPGTTDTADTAAMAISALVPAMGPTEGGTLVSVRGHGFGEDSRVDVGGSSCETLTWVSSTELICLTPPGPTGEADLTVRSGGEEATATWTWLGPWTDTGPVDTGPAPARIDWCDVYSPVEAIVEQGYSSDPIESKVWVEGRTEATGEAIGVEGQVGFGPDGSDPSTWAWEDTYWYEDDGANDLHRGYLYPDDVGAFDYATRFRVDHGDWTVCELDDGGYGALIVTESDDETPVDYCHLQYPCETSAAVGGTSEAIYGWIFQYDVTQGAGAGERIVLELGLGDDGTDPETDASWVWSEMAYNEDKDGYLEGDMANDEWAGTFVVPETPGEYDYVVRASADDGLTWTLCDQGGDTCGGGGSDDGYQSYTAGQLTAY
jgi:hypothetical protein